MYLLQGKLTAKEGHKKELAQIPIEASHLISQAKGSKIYVVGENENDDNDVYVTEILESKEDHDNSLNFPGVKELILKAMPILSGAPKKGSEFKILGGSGI